jgi:hypothetical protein
MEADAILVSVYFVTIKTQRHGEHGLYPDVIDGLLSGKNDFAGFNIVPIDITEAVCQP